ncbi:MAG: RNA methyltransferase [Roseburia sp.]|nr:RNA methyltransferase [Roseburia sp.]
MDIITSTSNRLFKHITKLKQKKYRDESGEFYIEGARNVFDTFSAAPDSVCAIVLSERAYAEHAERVSSCEVYVMADALMDKLSDTQSCQGVISVNKIPRYEFPTGERCLLLDRVRDPGNVGTILRTAVACGYDVVLNDCADVYSPKVTRSGMSALLKCRIGANIPHGDIKNSYELIAADIGGGDLFKTSAPRGKYCIVIGNEANGVAQEIINDCDRVISIPQSNIESLNAAVAAGIMMYTLKYRVGGN